MFASEARSAPANPFRGAGAAGRVPALSPSSPATRGGYDRPITVANGATYRSDIHRNTSSNPESK
jgi:hypothetical protein